MQIVKQITGIFIFLAFSTTLNAQEFTTDFTKQEFSARRDKVFEAIGTDGIALIQGAPSTTGYIKFRQSNEFYYLTGIEAPHAYVLLNGRNRSTTLYLPHRNPRREGGYGKIFSAEDGDLIQEKAGIEQTYGVEMLSLHLASAVRSSIPFTLHTPFSPPENKSMSRDLALRFKADVASDPWDGRASRQDTFIKNLAERFPTFKIENLTPILDELRIIKSPAELKLIRKASRLSTLSLMEGMRSTVPGIKEYELDAMAKYIYYRNGAQGDAYFSLIAADSTAYQNHYHGGQKTIKDGEILLMDYAPDVGYYMSDITRMWPVNGKFSDDQRDLYNFYLSVYQAILYRIRPHVTASKIMLEAVVDMEKYLETATFSKDIYRRRAEAFVASYKRRAPTTKSLGHFVGMATHDVGSHDGMMRPGMVFTIEPQFRIPEEKLYYRLEDLIIIGEEKAEIVSDFAPMDIEGIEKLMLEDGMLQKYPREKADK